MSRSLLWVIPVFFAFIAPAVAAPGLAGWRFGMSLDQVRAVKSCKPYTAVRTTGGLECKNFRFLGQKVNVSFVFRGGKLAKIQIWLYEGKSAKVAAARLGLLVRHWKKKLGAVDSPQLGRVDKLAAKALRAAVGELAQTPSNVGKLQLKPQKDPKDHFTFSSLFFNKRFGRYYLFVYRQSPRPRG